MRHSNCWRNNFVLALLSCISTRFRLQSNPSRMRCLFMSVCRTINVIIHIDSFIFDTSPDRLLLNSFRPIHVGKKFHNFQFQPRASLLAKILPYSQSLVAEKLVEFSVMQCSQSSSTFIICPINSTFRLRNFFHLNQTLTSELSHILQTSRELLRNNTFARQSQLLSWHCWKVPWILLAWHWNRHNANQNCQTVL